jgi:Leucine-rich repeat (LRR) protein
MNLTRTDASQVRCQITHFSWAGFERPYTCYLRDMNCQNEVTALTAVHKTGKTNSDLKVIELSYDANCKRIPNGFEKFIPNLEGISFTDCGITSISKQDLEPFPKLIFLDMTRNQIEYLEGNLFEATPNLKYIFFYDNKLTFVSANIFQTIKTIDFVNFDKNPCLEKSDYGSNLDEIKKSLALQCSRKYGGENIEKLYAEMREIEEEVQQNAAALIECNEDRLLICKQTEFN